MAMREARAAGVQVTIDGDALTLEASAAPPPAVIELLSRHKTEIIALLRLADDGWSALDWLTFFGERARMAAAHGLTGIEAEALRYRQKRNRSAHPGVRTFSGARVRAMSDLGTAT
jgi:hypothetical protein